MAKGGSFSLGASAKAIDPALDALFSASSGPVKPLPKSRYSDVPLPRPSKPVQNPDDKDESDEDQDDDASASEGSELSEEEDGEEEESSEEDQAVEDRLLGPLKKNKDRKRKRNDNEDLESRYLDKLVEEEESDMRKEKRLKNATKTTGDNDEKASTSSEVSGDEAEKDAEDDENDSDEDIPVHESLSSKTKDGEPQDSDIEKANRTVFLSNVAVDASTSKSSKRTLLNHLSTILSDSEKIESIRFRSLAFSTGALPKRAAYITHAVMEATTKSCNAYVVYPSPAAARTAVSKLNGTIVLDRHIRVDNVAHPSPIDHRRCVFVGNLGFVDDETVLNVSADGETKQRKRTKVPADVEEGLWREFSKHAGKVENVRVVRDPKTRVGKGFAYVQFYDENDVETALLLNEKKYPPMLPRTLRVTRAKAPHKTALAQERSKAKAIAAARSEREAKKSTKYRHKATPEEQSMVGRSAKLLGRAGAYREKKGIRNGTGRREQGGPPGNGSGVVPKTPEQIIFEGKRASANDGVPGDVRMGKKRGGKVNKSRVRKPEGRGAARAAAWKSKASK